MGADAQTTLGRESIVLPMREVRRTSAVQDEAGLMARTVTEWIGRNDDAAPPQSCKLRILDRQDNKCALTGHAFVPGDKIEYDHIVPLWLHGENREKNLHAVLGEAHKRKTKVEATVRAKVNATRAKHLLGKKSKSFQKPAGVRFNWTSGRYERVDP
jgi:5-methylcytosine-specific restriction protein A